MPIAQLTSPPLIDHHADAGADADVDVDAKLDKEHADKGEPQRKIDDRFETISTRPPLSDASSSSVRSRRAVLPDHAAETIPLEEIVTPGVAASRRGESSPVPGHNGDAASAISTVRSTIASIGKSLE